MRFLPVHKTLLTLTFATILSLGLLNAGEVSAENLGQPDPGQIPLQVFQLSDSSALKGRLVAVQGDHYLVESVSMGNISIRADNIVSITAANALVGAQPAAGVFADRTSPAAANYPPDQGNNLSALSGPQAREWIARMQDQMMQDPALMSAVQDLARDPTFTAILTDKELMNAIMSMDLEKIRNNPKAIELMNNPQMQEIMRKTGQKFAEPPVPDASNL